MTSLYRKLPWNRLTAIIAGTAVFSFGLHFFVIPNELMEGGLTGISLLAYYIFSIPPAVTTLVLNIPLFILGWRKFGYRAMLLTVFGTVMVSVWLFIIDQMIRDGWIHPLKTERDYFLITLYAGVSLGTGLGLVFRAGGTTGGVDIIARLLNQKKGWSIGHIMLTLDAAVIGLSLLFIPVEKVLYTLVAVYVASRLINLIIEGPYEAKAFYIVTNHGEAVAKAISDTVDRGVTLIPAIGAYSRQAKEIVYCVVSREQIGPMKTAVRATDPTAFIIIANVHDVLGEGFERSV